MRFMKKGIFLGYLFLLFFGCSNNQGNVDLFYSDIEIKDSATDIEIKYYLKEKLEFVLTAEAMTQVSDPEEKTIIPKGIDVIIYNNYLDTVATISSDFGVQKEGNNLVDIAKNVNLVNKKNEQLNTERLFWSRTENKIYTDEFVTLNKGDQIIMGYGFVTDQSFSTYSLSNITATLYP